MRLVLDVRGTQIEFTEPGTDAPYPWLAKVGNLLLAARAGHLSGLGIGETANVIVDLDNANRQFSSLVGYCPRARATLYDDDDDVYFDGLVQQVAFGQTCALTLEA